MDALTRDWAFEFGDRGITVNSVAPGMIDTEMSREGIQNRDKVLRGAGLKQMGQVDDVADVVAFLACSESRWITGEVIGVTGVKSPEPRSSRLFELCSPGEWKTQFA